MRVLKGAARLNLNKRVSLSPDSIPNEPTSNGTLLAEQSPLAAPRDPFHTGPHIWVRSWRALWASTWPSIRFIFQTEVQVYSFAVAANVLLCFFPFLVAMILLCHHVLHWQAAIVVITQTVHEYIPQTFGMDIAGYLVLAANRHTFSLLSVALLFFAANGIFTCPRK